MAAPGHDYFSQPFQRGIVAIEAGVASSDSCSYNPDYRRESEVLFTVYDIAQPSDATPCQGYTWIGQTQFLSVEAVTRVTCPYEATSTRADVRISDSPIGLGNTFASHSEICGITSSCLASVNTAGTTGASTASTPTSTSRHR